jgi:hypothetical protein
MELPLAAASRRLRRPPGRPKRVAAAEGVGLAIGGAAPQPAIDAAPRNDFAATLPPRGLPVPAASAYSGLPVRRLWALIADGLLRPIRPPGCRLVLVDRCDLDELLVRWKGGPADTDRSAQAREAVLARGRADRASRG